MVVLIKREFHICPYPQLVNLAISINKKQKSQQVNRRLKKEI